MRCFKRTTAQYSPSNHSQDTKYGLCKPPLPLEPSKKAVTWSFPKITLVSSIIDCIFLWFLYVENYFCIIKRQVITLYIQGNIQQFCFIICFLSWYQSHTSCDNNEFFYYSKYLSSSFYQTWSYKLHSMACAISSVSKKHWFDWFCWWNKTLSWKVPS